MQTPDSFWRLDVSNLLTMAGVVVAWVLTKVWDARGVKDGVEQLKLAQTKHEKLVKEWQVSHEADASRRDSTLQAMQLAVQELKSLASFSERRLAMLENREKPGAIERIHERLDDIARNLKP